MTWSYRSCENSYLNRPFLILILILTVLKVARCFKKSTSLHSMHNIL